MDYELTGTIFNTQKFSIHDGDGIRTLIFMKGCPLACLWCSNPESQSPDIEVMDVKSNCTGCGKCAALCDCHAVKGGSFDIDRSLCRRCGKCAAKCYANAKKLVGKRVTIRELMQLIEKDRVFYTNSGGGVTIGGGEPLAQPLFVRELLRTCRESNIHTAIETCGYGQWENIKEVFEAADQIFFDLKAMNPDLHWQLTGVRNDEILENAVRAAELGKEIIFRVPLVLGCNDSADNMKETGNFVSYLQKKNSGISIELLPYHNLGEDKYRWLGRTYSLAKLEKPCQEELNACRQLLAERCGNVLTGGKT